MASMFNYRYPNSTIDSSQDFIKFSVFKYTRGSKSINVQKASEEQSLSEQEKNNGKEARDPSTLEGKQYGALENVNIGNSVLVGGARAKDYQGSILLPIPSQLSDTNATNFGESSLNSFYAAAISQTLGITGAQNPEEFIKNIGGLGFNAATVATDPKVAGILKLFTAQQAISALGANISFEQLFTRATGEVINPNMELLFNGPTLRQFKFSFKLTPRDQPEAQKVKNIIRSFKKHMAPSGKNTNFLKTPDIFQLQYIGKSSNYLNRFKLCALTNMSVNYTGEGNYATYEDGAPVSMIMDLAFQELEPVYAEDYDNSGGVGY